MVLQPGQYTGMARLDGCISNLCSYKLHFVVELPKLGFTVVQKPYQVENQARGMEKSKSRPTEKCEL
jgi:hypothetical protein